MRTMFRALDSWWLDVKLGVRMLIKYPGLALAGGVGIAVAVAIAAGAIQRHLWQLPGFSRCPFEEGDRMVSIEIWDSAASRARTAHPARLPRLARRAEIRSGDQRLPDAHAKPDRSRRPDGERPRCRDERLGIPRGAGSSR